MIMPVTGPLTDNWATQSPPDLAGNRMTWVKQTKTWFRQKKPFDLPLEYHYDRRSISAWHEKTLGCQTGVSPWALDYTAVVPAALDANLYNKAYNRFKDKMGAHVELGIDAAEGRQSMDMIKNRLLQLAKFTFALSRGRVGAAAEALGVTTPRSILQKTQAFKREAKALKNKASAKKGWKTPSRESLLIPRRETMKSFANLYLEFHFGWSPLVKDIYDAMEVLSKPFSPKPVHASARQVIVSTFSQQPYFNSYTNSYDYQVAKRVTSQKVKIGADMRVTNPNLALNNQLGIVNPATVAWEIVPFSFVLDWFVNVGDFLSSFTDFAGVELTNQYWTDFTLVTKQHNFYSDVNRTSDLQQVKYGCNSYDHFAYHDWYNWFGVIINRNVGSIPGPTLKVRNPWVLSPRRGLAAASLLMQRFPSKIIEDARPVLSAKKSPFRNGILPPHFWV